MIGTTPPKDYVRTKGDEALSRLREFDVEVELLTYRVERLEGRIWLLLIALVMVAFLFGLYLWAGGR